MKKTIFIVITCLVIILTGSILFKQNFGRSYHHTFTKSTDLSKENIEGLYLGDRIQSDKIVSRYGEITEISREHATYQYYYLRDGIEVVTEKNDDKIIRFIVMDGEVQSEKKIGMGDSKEEVIVAYGEHYYSRVEQGVDIIGYVDKENNCSIEFWFGEDGINMIRLDYNYMA